MLNLNSSWAARKGLAAELRYPGSTDYAAAMDIWLYGEVMRKLVALKREIAEYADS